MYTNLKIHNITQTQIWEKHTFSRKQQPLVRTHLLCDRLCEDEPLSELSVEYCVVPDTCSFSVIHASTLLTDMTFDTCHQLMLHSNSHKATHLRTNRFTPDIVPNLTLVHPTNIPARVLILEMMWFSGYETSGRILATYTSYCPT